MGRRRNQRKGWLHNTGASWMLTYRVDVWNPEKGDFDHIREKPRYIGPSKGPEGLSRRQAERLAWDEHLSRLDANSIRSGTRNTFWQFVNAHFPSVMLKKRQGGREQYMGIITKHLCPGAVFDFELSGKTEEQRKELREKRAKSAEGMGEGIAAVPMRDLSHDHVQRLIDSRLAHKPPYSVQTLRHIKNCIGRIVKYARVKGCYTGELPIEGIELPESDAKERTPLTAQVAYQVAYALQSPYHELCLLMMVTGLRIAEALGLRWQDIDFDAGLIRAEGRETFRRGKYQSFKTKGSKHPIPLDEQTLKDLAALKARVARYEIPAKKKDEPPVIADYSQPQHPVFCSSVGTPLSAANALRRVLKPVLKALSLPGDIGFHNLRHSAATWHEQQGATVSDRRGLLGHSTDAMALHYAHGDLERMRESVTRVRALIDAEKPVGGEKLVM